MRLRRIGAVVVLLGSSWAAGCSSTGAAGNDAGATDPGLCLTCLDASDERSDLARVKGTIDQRCASSDGCHGQGAGGLSFSDGMEFTPLVGVPSFEVPGLDRVVPGDPARSYMYLKLACDGGIQGACMPLDGPISASLLQSFHDWIEAGAPTQ